MTGIESETIFTRDQHETRDLGELIGKTAQAGDIILLTGPLGSGKTCLTQGIALGLGIESSITSPTFVLVREYHGRLALYHADLYRLDLAEIRDLGIDDYLNGDGLCVVEWAEKGLPLMPVEHLRILLEYTDTEMRRITFSPCGGHFQKLTRAVLTDFERYTRRRKV